MRDLMKRDRTMDSLFRGIERMFEPVWPSLNRHDSVFDFGFNDFKTDLIEEDDRYILKAELPGIESDNLNIQYENDILTIECEKKECSNNNHRWQECKWGKMQRSFHLPGINSEGIEASYNKGVLTVELKLNEKLSKKKINVKFE